MVKIRVEKLTGGPLATGTRGAATIDSRGRPLDMAMEVTDYTRPNRLGSRTIMASAEIHGAVTFEQQNRQIWAGLKRYLEGIGPAPDASGTR